MFQARPLYAAVFSLVAFSGGLFSAPVHADSKELDEEISEQSAGLPLAELRNFSDIFARIKSDYVEEVSDEALLEHAIRGMLSGLDPHSTYMNKDEYNELKIGTSGEFGGLGIQVGMENGFVKVISPIDDTPAYHAGIQAGDLIIRLDNKPVKDISLNDAVKIMRGKPGTKIALSIMREGEDKPLEFVIERAIIKVESVKTHLLEPGFAYIRLSTFQAKTAVQLREAISKLVKENGGLLDGMILDLRNNPGGVLNAAADVADLFIRKGKLVYTKGRKENSYFEFNANSDDVMNDKPIVVLINAGSASASEIVAGALQDHKRAVIMGEKSFGKGSVQTIQELRNGAAVKFTTARYYTPNGRSIQAEGIEPDIALKDMQLTVQTDSGQIKITEADLSGHLLNGEKQDKLQKKNAAEEKQDNEIVSKLRSDYKVHEALNLLKGMHILSPTQASKIDKSKEYE
ncbi:MAG TPA: S41 family peptidase [Gammaproteobacteria bacterium]